MSRNKVVRPFTPVPMGEGWSVEFSLLGVSRVVTTLSTHKEVDLFFMNRVKFS